MTPPLIHVALRGMEGDFMSTVHHTEVVVRAKLIKHVEMCILG